MNDEIKEILDRLEGRKNWYLHQQKNNGVFNDEDYMAYMLLDYITNLQQENERLKFQLENQQIISSKYRMRRNIYKSRCEKAIELLNKRKNEVNEDLWVEMRAKDYFEECDEIIYILQNGSDTSE